MPTVQVPLTAVCYTCMRPSQFCACAQPRPSQAAASTALLRHRDPRPPRSRWTTNLGHTRTTVRVLLEALCPSHRVAHLDEFCPPTA